MQVFFYFSGHGANVGQYTQILYGNDGKGVSFYQLFHKEVTSKGCPVIAVLDCCRNTSTVDPSKIITSVCLCMRVTMCFKPIDG